MLNYSHQSGDGLRRTKRRKERQTMETNNSKSKDTVVSDSVLTLNDEQATYFEARRLLGDAANLLDSHCPEAATDIRNLLAKI